MVVYQIKEWMSPRFSSRGRHYALGCGIPASVLLLLVVRNFLEVDDVSAHILCYRLDLNLAEMSPFYLDLPARHREDPKHWLADTLAHLLPFTHIDLHNSFITWYTNWCTIYNLNILRI